jgi:Domain of unknown function (DUF4326)
MRIVNVGNIGMSELKRIGGVYCGRPSVLGNPFSHKDIPGTTKVGSREEAIEAYRKWLWMQLKAKNRQVIDALKALNDNSILGCWCSPAKCHCSVIERASKWLRS